MIENEEKPSYTCTCRREENVPYGCSKALGWFKTLNKGKDVSHAKMKELYLKLINCQELSDCEDQIMKDLTRTFPKCPQFIDPAG